MSARVLDTVAITAAETRRDPDVYVVYVVQVSTKQKSWNVFKRYSDFDAFNAVLRSKYGISVDFPPKKTFGNMDPSLVERRRGALERYLKTIVLNKDEQLATCPELMKFLEVDKNAKLRSHEKDDISFETWLKEQQELANMAGQISAHLSSRQKLLQQGENDAADTLAARKLFAAYLSKYHALQSAISSDNACKELGITEQELLRRKNMMSTSKMEMDRLDNWLKNPLMGNAGSSRSDLFASSVGSSSASAGRQPRRFGPEETEETRKHDNDGLMQIAKQTMVAQDKTLDYLLASIERTKHMALAIGEEVDVQNAMLDDLDSAVDKTQDKLKRTGKKLIKTMS